MAAMIEDIEPGQYRLRNGIVATVSKSNDTLHPPFFWVGSVAGEIEVWDRRGRHQSNGKESPWDLVARIPDETPADNRIERALQVLRNAQTYDCHSGDALGGMKACEHNAGDWVEAEVVSEVRKILENEPTSNP
jgi:hypothetical protein